MNTTTSARTRRESDHPLRDSQGARGRSNGPTETISERLAFQGVDNEMLVAQCYRYTSNDTKNFIVEHPQVAQALTDALPKIQEFFGKEVVVSLRVSGDQESALLLSANIETALEVSEARAARKLFYASWWMRQADIEELPLTFNLQYV